MTFVQVHSFFLLLYIRLRKFSQVPMSITPSNISVMPSESSLKKQTEIVREALKSFNTIQSLNSPGLLKTALNELLDATVFFHMPSFRCSLFNPAPQVLFHNYIPFFNSHPLFQEIPPAVCSAVDDFVSKNPNFEVPVQFQKVIALDTKIKDVLNANFPKRAGSVPSAPRSDRIKKTKPAVSLLFRSFFLSISSFSQGKRPRISKEFIDDSDGDEPAVFLPSPATLTIKPSSNPYSVSSLEAVQGFLESTVTSVSDFLSSFSS